ncbi:MAG TPA: NAD(P)H-dependent oxidoreductase subunit E [Armatimonadota bacterium]|jgi:NADH:ubiquinone oxidoreductase subunit E
MAGDCLCAETYPKIDAIIVEKGAVPDSLIEILHAVQEEVGYLPQPVQEYIADALDMPVGTVEGVVSFYSFFTVVPRGRHTIKVCLGTACYVRGGKRVMESVAKHAGCGIGETSEDLKYSLEVVRCIGACGLSPVMTVDEDIFDRVKPTKVTEILNKYE